MAIEKSEFKMAVAHELGVGFDDALEQASREVHKWDGAKIALGDAAIAIDALLAHIARDVKEEKMTIEASNDAQKYVRRAAEICRNLRLKAEIHEQRAHGAVEAYKKVVRITKTFHDKERDKVAAVRAHENLEINEDVEEAIKPASGPRRTPRPVGTRPKNLIAARKNAERGADKQDEKVE